MREIVADPIKMSPSKLKPVNAVKTSFKIVDVGKKKFDLVISFRFNLCVEITKYLGLYLAKDKNLIPLLA